MNSTSKPLENVPDEFPTECVDGAVFSVDDYKRIAEPSKTPQLIAVPMHDFPSNGIAAYARNWAKNNLPKTVTNTVNNHKKFVFFIASDCIKKYVSTTFEYRGDGVEDKKKQHLSALKYIAPLLETAVLQDAEDGDKPHIVAFLIFKSRMAFEGKNYPLRLSVEVIRNHGNKAHAYRVLAAEVAP